MGSFMDRMKEKLHAAGEGAKRLGEVANLKLELGDARKDLERKYRKLGEHTAAGLIDGEAGRIEASDPTVTILLDEVRRARAIVAELEAELEKPSGEGARPTDEDPAGSTER